MKKQEQEQKILVPGESLKWSGLEGVEVTVYPLGVRHLRRFSREIVGTASTLAGNRDLLSKLSGSGSDAAVGGALVAHLAPFLIDSCYDLIDECTTVEGAQLGDLPHQCLPSIIEVWLTSSFGDEEQRRPWVAAATKAWTMATGQDSLPPRISEMFSKSSPQPGTPSETSSTGKPDAPIPAGASPN